MDVLILLAKKGATLQHVRISTTQIGRELDMSQQNASRIILELEKSGKISRTVNGIDITEKGANELKKLYEELGLALGGKRTSGGSTDLLFSGTVTQGLGEGAYYVKQYSDRIKKTLGFVPFPGTLNIRLDKRSGNEKARMNGHASKVIEGFEKDGRKFGKIFAYLCTIRSGKSETESCFVVMPERTHHSDSIIELISRHELKGKFPEGKKVRIKVNVQN
ncbi:TPA: CTP-dependent riboflavin kinase [Candidatus Micrarchaeota archaeon]|nr:CTP-dependent riboflavin kinase [Candidatus Micrarchaeota archaeon]